ncbi:MAG: hypothetical protein ACYCXN_02850 [Acidimicrobiales bacterium]
MSQLSRWSANLLIWAGSGLVVVSAVVHFHLWESDGYNHIPTIGPLFLMQAVVGALLAVVTSISRHWLLALAEAGFAIATLGGFLISVNVGLFGWQDSWAAPFASLSLGVEVAGAAMLLTASALLFRPWSSQRGRNRHSLGTPRRARNP